MATLKLIDSTTNELFDVSDLDFASVTPNDVLSSDGIGLPMGEIWQMSKGSQVLDGDTTLNKLGLKDGDKVLIMRKMAGA